MRAFWVGRGSAYSPGCARRQLHMGMARLNKNSSHFHEQLWQLSCLPRRNSTDTDTCTLPSLHFHSCAADIVAGQGMFFSPASGLFRAVNCSSNNYGVASKTTGLAAYPCRACPAGMQTDIALFNSNAYKAANGFHDPKACVTKVGFGYNGRIASQCRPDSYNAAGNYATCTQCPTGALLSLLVGSSQWACACYCAITVFESVPVFCSHFAPSCPTLLSSQGWGQ